MSRGEELLVWYGEEYAKDLGICSSELHRCEQKKQNPKKINVTEDPSEVVTPKIHISKGMYIVIISYFSNKWILIHEERN